MEGYLLGYGLAISSGACLFISKRQKDMSLKEFRRPRLADKLAAAAEQAEQVRETLETSDEKEKKIIKKASKKK